MGGGCRLLRLLCSTALFSCSPSASACCHCCSSSSVCTSIAAPSCGWRAAAARCSRAAAAGCRCRHRLAGSQAGLLAMPAGRRHVAAACMQQRPSGAGPGGWQEQTGVEVCEAQLRHLPCVAGSKSRTVQAGRAVVLRHSASSAAWGPRTAACLQFWPTGSPSTADWQASHHPPMIGDAGARTTKLARRSALPCGLAISTAAADMPERVLFSSLEPCTCRRPPPPPPWPLPVHLLPRRWPVLPSTVGRSMPQAACAFPAASVAMSVCNNLFSQGSHVHAHLHNPHNMRLLGSFRSAFRCMPGSGLSSPAPPSAWRR